VIGDRLQPLDANLHFRAKGIPEFWNPIDGSKQRVTVYQSTASGTTLPVRLPVAGSVFVVFRPGDERPSFQRVTLDNEVLFDATNRKHVDTAKPFPAFGLTRRESIQPWVNPKPPVFEMEAGSQDFVAWQDGEYQFSRRGAEPTSVAVTGTNVIPLRSGWSLSFPSGWDTPSSIKLDAVQPWSEMADDGVRHFSGTATYQTTFHVDDLLDDDRLLLDLGRVGVIAEIEVNGKDAGVIWAAPYRRDITDFVQSGENQLKIAVTNTWHNRLALDASLPKGQRKTWTYHAPTADSALDYSGLSKSVQLHKGKQIALPGN
jgi:hypothetical protein